MSECSRCLTKKQEKTFNGQTVHICLNVDCLIERMLEKYEGCSHEFETVGNYLLKCEKCNMGATPSYINSKQ